MLHPRAAPPGELQVWLGSTVAPTGRGPEFRLDGVLTRPEVVRPFTAGIGGVHTGLFSFTGITPGSRHVVSAGTGTELATLDVRAMPAEVPPDGFGTFNVLLASCYHRDEDRGIARVLSRLPAPPDLTLLMGDQVYLDLPTLTNFRSDSVPWLAGKFQRDYVRNYIDPDRYARILHAAPGAALPDDHEYWNNAPHPSPVVPDTWHAQKRANWQRAAGALYDEFQLSSSGRDRMLTLDVAPLSFFLMDTRTFRRADRTATLHPDTLAQLRSWVDGVIAGSRYGVVVTGQSLLHGPSPAVAGAVGDRHPADYGDHPAVMAELLRLVRAGRPALCLTGDVHYGQVLTATENGTGARLHEVISSPAALVTTVGKDQVAGLGGWIKGDPDPRHRTAPGLQPFRPPGSPGGFRLERHYPQHREKGDHVVLLRFRRSGFGLEMTATYVLVGARDTPSVTIALKPTV